MSGAVNRAGEPATPSQEIGIDVGGTFTDIAVTGADGRLTTLKVLSTPDDYSRAIMDGVGRLGAAARLDARAVARVIHAFTVATNALLTGRGARVGLITTRGFRDVLEIGRLRMPRLYDMGFDKPRPLVPRRLRHEVTERLDADGGVVTPLIDAEAERVVRGLVAMGVDSVAVCLLHAYANPVHERRLVEILGDLAPALSVSASHRVLPEMREFERTSTTVVNAFVRPVVGDYLGRLESRLSGAGVRAPLMVMQSSGGVVPAQAARDLPAYCIESGPAAGAIAAAALGRMLGIPNVIAFDMGGTTAKACLIEGGQPRLAREIEVGAGINAGSRLLSGGGYAVRAPSVDLAEIGAGGGSLAWRDAGGALRVGPESAGAVPGPACYGLGGDRPTVTDANVILGFLNRESLLGGEMAIDAGLAETAMRRHVGAPLGLGVAEAAHGVHAVADAVMVRAIRAVSSEQGRAPADFALIAFGGSGPVHAATLAREAGMRRVIVPPASGVFSAVGLLFTDVEHRLVRTVRAEASGAGLDRLNGLIAEMSREGGAMLADEGFSAPEIVMSATLDLRYAGQSDEIGVPVEAPLDAAGIAAAIAAFHAEHARTYGYSGEGEAVHLVAVRLRACGAGPRRADLASRVDRAASPSSEGTRRVYFGPEGWRDVPVLARDALSNESIPGPLVVEEYDTTTIVPPGATARLVTGCIVIDLADGAEGGGS